MSAKSFYLLLFFCTSRLLIANSLENNTASPVRQSDGLVPRRARTAVTSHIPRASVASKGIASIGYSKRLHILEIEFVNGAVYRYLQVAPSVHRDLMAADSKARYYDANIKGNYPSVRVRPRVKQEAR
ncbi:MAG: KTSC domain-containing protein [Verrucomicrobiota bacterium]|nr:KTSC domain-containing protein [Verrucomicrobiota bacterium]